MSINWQPLIMKAIREYQLPLLAVQILKLLGSDIFADEQQKILCANPGASTKLLSLANSPLYNQVSREITSVEFATSMMGERKTREVLVGIALVESFGKSNTESAIQEMLIKESLFSAYCGQSLSKATKIGDPDTLYTCGLLNHMGMLVLLNVAHDLYLPMLRKYFEEGDDLIAAEQEKFQINHAEIGQALLQQLQLPQVIVDMVRTHEEASRTDQAQLLNYLGTKMGRLLASVNGSLSPNDVFGLIAKHLSFSNRQTEAIINQATSQVEQWLKLFDFKSAEAMDILDIQLASNAYLQKKLAEEQKQRQVLEIAINQIKPVLHDLRNKIMSAGGNTECALEMCDSASQQFKHLNIAFSSYQHVTSLLNEIRFIFHDLNGNEPGTKKRVTPQQKTRGKFNQLIETFCQTALVDDGSLKVESKLDEKLHEACAALTETQLMQIISNLLINSQQAGASKVLMFTKLLDASNGTASANGLKPGKYAAVVIADNGHGVPDEIAPKMFQPAISSKPNNDGIGLNTIYNILKDIGGKISFIGSQQSWNTVFKIFIPLAEAS